MWSPTPNDGIREGKRKNSCASPSRERKRERNRQMDLPPLIHHHPNSSRYAHIPSQLPDDPNFYGNHRHHHHLLQPSPALPPPPPPPSYRPLTVPPPPPPFSPHQSQFTFRSANPSPNPIRLIDDEPGSLHHHHHRHLDVGRSPHRVSNRTLLDDDRHRLRVHHFDNSRPEFWDPSRVSTENRPPRLYPVIRSDHETSHHRSFNHNPVSPFRAIGEFRHDPEGSSRFRDELNGGFEHKRVEELVWGRGEGRSHDDFDRHSHLVQNANKSLRNIGFGDSHFVVEPDSSSLGNYDSRYGSSRDEEFIRNGRGDGVSENQRWAHSRQPQRDVANYLIGLENNEIDDGGGVQVFSFKRGPNALELGKFTNRGSREGSHEFTRSPRKKVQKKSALLRIQLQKPSPRKRDDGQFYYDESTSSQYRGKEPLEYLDHGMADKRERSPVELDVSFKSNSLVAKAIMAPSSPTVVSDRNLCLIPRNRELRKITLPNMDNSSSQLNKLNEEPVKRDCLPSVVADPSLCHKDPKQLKEKVTASGLETVQTFSSKPCSSGTNISLENNRVEGSLNSMVSEKVAANIGSGGMSSPKVTKKKKVIRKVSIPISRASNSQLTKKPGEAPGSSTLRPSAASSSNNAAHPKEKITSAGLISVTGVNEVTALSKNNKVNESLLSNISEKSVTDTVSGQACVAELTETRNRLSPPSGFSSQKETSFHEGPINTEGSIHDLNVISNSEKGLTRSPNETTYIDIDGISDVSMQICQNGPSVSLENDVLKGSSETMLSVGGNVNVCLSSLEETKIHEGLANTNNSVHDLNIGSSSDCDLIKTQEKISTSDIGTVGAVSRHPCSNHVSVLLENPRPFSLGGNASVPVLCSKENRTHEGPLNVDGSSNGTGTALTSDHGLTKSQEKITASNTGIVDDAGKQLSQDGVIMSVENGAIERPAKDMASMGGNLNVDSGKDYTPKGKKKRKIRTSQSDLSHSAKVHVKPLNVITSRHDVHATLSCSMKDPSLANSYVGSLKVGSEACEDRVSVLHGNSSMKDLSEAKVSFRDVDVGQNGTSPKLKKRRKGFVPDPGFSSPMGPEIHKESLIPDASMIGPEVPSNSNDCLTQSEEQVPVSGITMSATGLQPCLEGNTVLPENRTTRGNFEAMSSVGNDSSANDMKFVQPSVIVEELAIPSLQSSGPSGLRVELIETPGMSSVDHQNEIMGLESGIRERISVHGLEESGMLRRGTADCKSTAALETLDLNRRQLSTGMECDTHTLMKDDKQPTVSNYLSIAADGNGVSPTNSNDELMQSLPDTHSNMASPETLPIIPGLHTLDTELSVEQISDQKGCGDDRKSDEKPMVDCGSVLFAHNSCSQSSESNFKLDDAIGSDNSINGKTVQPSSQDTKRTTHSVNLISGELNGSKNHLNNLVPRVFPAPSSFFLANSKKTASSTHIAKPRTWYRTGASSSSLKKPLSIAFPPQRQLKKIGKVQGTSYIRKGNSLVRKPAPVAVIPQGSHGLSSSVYRLNPSGVDEMRKRTGSESRTDVIDPSNRSSTGATDAPSERPQTPPLPYSTKLPKCTTISSGDCATSPLVDPLLNGCSGNMPDPAENIKVPMSSEDGAKSSGSTENQTGLINNLESQSVLNDGNSESSKLKRVTYVKRKSNQLVAASNPHDMSVQNADKTPALSSDGYYKRRKNQLIRTSLESHIKQTVAIPDDGSNSEGQRPSKLVSSKSSSKRPSDKVLSKTREPSKFSLVWTLRGAQSSEKDGNSVHSQGVLPSLFPWKRATYWRSFMHNPASISNSTSLSMISRKLLLLRKRDTVYTRSTGGFSLRKSKVLGVGGSSLKWSKSIERQSKKANEEATLAVAAVERKKREQNGAASVISETESRNHSSRERIFRVGSVRYKMDSSRRTLQRISDGDSTCSAALQSEKNAKKPYIPRRLLIGNDEYVQIGNGNQLIRNPKKRTRILASEKVRWSLHTARLRLAKKWKYCQFFTRFGKCNKDDGKCPYIHDPSKIAVCTKFLNGLCSNPNCKLTHKVIPERMPDCSYFLQGLCNNESCPYRHVNVNPNASVCEGFLRGYCADGNECRKKHSYVCPIFEATGSCPLGSKCKLHHPKNRSKGKKKKQSRELNAQGRYFGFRHVNNRDPEKVVSEKDTAKNNDDISFQEGRFADYISLDVSDEDIGSINGPRTQQTTLFGSEPSYLHLDDLDELIKPVLIMNKNLTA